MQFPQRAYLLEVGWRMPKASVLRRLVDWLALLRYNEFLVYSANGGVEIPQELVRYAKMKDVEISSIDAAALLALRAEGVAEASTEAARSLAGRVEEMRERMERAASAGRERGARRFLVTDFSDGRDWHSPVVSLPGMVLGGHFAMMGVKAAKIDLERELSQFLDAPLAGTLLKLGTLYLRGGARREDASEFFNILAGDIGYSRHPGITDHVLAEVSTILRGIMAEVERHVHRSETAKEILYSALLLDSACHRRSEARLRTVREEFVRMWNRHFESSNRDAAAAKLPRF